MKQLRYACALFFIAASLAYASDARTEEKAIRTAIAQNPDQYTADAIFWSGAYRRPVILPEKAEEFPGRELSKRRNQKVGNPEIQRIEVSASGDLAYEFSYTSLDFDETGATQHHISVKSAMLRVWKKVDGQWRVAALFVRPMDIPFEDLGVASSPK